jgi:hypothetical protein
VGQVFRHFSAPGQYVRLAIQPSGGVSVERIELCRITYIRHLDVPFLQGPSAVPPKGHMYKHDEHRRFTARFSTILSDRPGLSLRPIQKPDMPWS